MGYNFVGGIFIRLAVVGSQYTTSREIPREFDLVVVQDHPRSSILVSIESVYIDSKAVA